MTRRLLDVAFRFTAVTHVRQGPQPKPGLRFNEPGPQVICSFRGSVTQGLALEVGETVQILEKCEVICMFPPLPPLFLPSSSPRLLLLSARIDQ
ncbi:hypothetical protein PAMA_010078 [Pampus argenteus]